MTTKAQPPRRGGLDLDAILYWELPQLDADELASLTATVRSELETRVGEQLSSRCTDDQLAEFERLVDRQDDEICTHWLDEHIPNHQEISRAEIDGLLAETFAAVEGTQQRDPSVSRPRRRRIEPADKALLLRTLDFQQRHYSMDGDVAVAELVCGSGVLAKVRLWMTENGLFCARSLLPFPAPEHRPELLTFVHTWNRKTYFPKAYAEGAPDGTCDLVAESAVPLAPGTHGQLLDHIVTVCLGATTRLFDELLDTAAAWQPPPA
jgi:hypothetical protein